MVNRSMAEVFHGHGFVLKTALGLGRNLNLNQQSVNALILESLLCPRFEYLDRRRLAQAWENEEEDI